MVVILFNTDYQNLLNQNFHGRILPASVDAQGYIFG